MPISESDPNIHIPTARDVLDGGLVLLFQHGAIVRAQAKSVIAHAIKRGVEPAAAATLFAATLLQLVADEHADADEFALFTVVGELVDAIRDQLIAGAMQDELRGVVTDVA